MSETDFDPEYVFSHHHATPEKLKSYAEELRSDSRRREALCRGAARSRTCV